jgi:hypothetical protein
MSKNTVKPTLRRKRAKRVVENDQFDGFVRRILAAYARRVAAGDIEALRSLAALSSEVDAATRLAVVGLRQPPYRYSWSEIADRLGVSRQAAQMRYGDRTESGALDRRLVETGLGVGLDTLVAVFADHCRGIPAASVCPGCGYRFPADDLDGDCPTNLVVRPLLQRRQHERLSALRPLTPAQMAELEVKPKFRTTNRTTAPSEVVAGELFDTDPLRRMPRAGLDPAPRRRMR